MWEYLVKRIRPTRPQVEGTDVHRPHPVDASLPGEGVPVHGEGVAGETYAHPDRVTDERSTAERSRRLQRARALQCPVCHLSMELERIGRVEIDRCAKCGGIFLDRGELAELSGRDPSSYVPGTGDRGFLIYTPHGLSDHVRDS